MLSRLFMHNLPCYCLTLIVFIFKITLLSRLNQYNLLWYTDFFVIPLLQDDPFIPCFQDYFYVLPVLCCQDYLVVTYRAITIISSELTVLCYQDYFFITFFAIKIFCSFLQSRLFLTYLAIKNISSYLAIKIISFVTYLAIKNIYSYLAIEIIFFITFHCYQDCFLPCYQGHLLIT
jgi:hypothetical protein